MSALSRTDFATRSTLQAPALDVYDGLDDLEEEDEDGEASEEESVDSLYERAVHGDPGDGILQLQRLWERCRDSGEEPDLDAPALADLHALLARDAPDCPSVATVAWIARTLEDLAIEEDDILEVLASILVERSDELEPQSVLDAVCSFGNLYWTGDDLLDALAKAVRRQVNDFTQSEVVRLANGLTRMGGTDDTKYVGVFFELRQRVNLPHVDKFIRDAMSRDARGNRDGSEAMQALEHLSSMPNRTLKGKVQKLLQWKLDRKAG